MSVSSRSYVSDHSVNQCDFNELRSDANAVAGLPDAAFEDGQDVKLLCDRRQVRILALEEEGRRA
jgi:hypothetical protein